MNTSYSSKGNGILYLFNEGKAEARNISWLFDNDILEKINKEGTYERLSPGQRIGFNYYLLTLKLFYLCVLMRLWQPLSR